MARLKSKKSSLARKRQDKKRKQNRRKPVHKRKPIFEALEPRILLSSDFTYMGDEAFDIALRLENDSGVETLKLIDSELGEVASRALSDVIDTVQIFGSDFDDIFRVEIDPSIISANIAEGIIFDAGEW